MTAPAENNAAASTGTDGTTSAASSTDGSATDTGDETLAEIKALADELGITPGQLKGRLDASRKWEQRAKNSTDAATKAAGEAQKAQKQLAQVAQILGLAPDDATPEKLQAQIADRDGQLAARDKELADLRKERDVEKAVRAHKGDVDLVVPALMYNGSLADLDPAADDFATKLDSRVKEFIERNPKYRSAAEFPDLKQGNQGQGAAASNDPNAWLRQMAGRQ